MGHSGLNAQTTMKFALVVCFAALVACEPEAQPQAKADPWLTYGYGAYPYGYSGLHYGYAGYPYATHGLYYGKRSAEAEPEAAAKADPWLTYGAYGAYPYAGSLVSTTVMPDTPMPPMDITMARGLPRLSPKPMLMLCTGTTVMAPGPTTDWDTEVTDMEDTEVTTMDKFPASEAQSRSSKRTSLLVI